MLRGTIFTAAILLAGCYDSSFGTPEGNGNGTPPAANTTLAELRGLYAGQTFRIQTDVIVTGIVSTHDQSENFYRTFCITQDGAGMEIMAGVDHLHNTYPIGCRVTLRLKGLALGESRGVLQLGRMPKPGSGYATDYIGSKAALDACIIRHDDALAAPQPAVRRIPELTPGLCGTLVRVESLRYTPEDLTPGSWAGYKRFTDSGGAEIFTFVREYASFAPESVPDGLISLSGILQYDPAGDGRYILKLRDETDCTP